MSALRLTLPDQSVREVPAGTTPRQVAEAIGPGLARAALVAKVDGVERAEASAVEGTPALARLDVAVADGAVPEEVTERVVAALVTAGAGVQGVRATKASLEEVFRKLTTEEPAA